MKNIKPIVVIYLYVGNLNCAAFDAHISDTMNRCKSDDFHLFVVPIRTGQTRIEVSQPTSIMDSEKSDLELLRELKRVMVAERKFAVAAHLREAEKELMRANSIMDWKYL